MAIRFNPFTSEFDLVNAGTTATSGETIICTDIICASSVAVRDLVRFQSDPILIGDPLLLIGGGWSIGDNVTHLVTVTSNSYAEIPNGIVGYVTNKNSLLECDILIAGCFDRPSGLTDGADLWVSTSGTITDTEPPNGIKQHLGWASVDESMVFRPQKPEVGETCIPVDLVTSSTSFETIYTLETADDSVLRLKFEVLSRQITGTKRALFKREGLFYNESGSAMIDRFWHTPLTIENDSTFDVRYVFSNENILIQVKAPTSDLTSWKGSLCLLEIT